MGVVLQHAFIMVVDNLSKLATASGVEEEGVGAWRRVEPPSCDLKRGQPPNSANCFGNKSI